MILLSCLNDFCCGITNKLNCETWRQPSLLSLVQHDLAAPTRCAWFMTHRGEGNLVLVVSQFSHNISVSLNNTNKGKNLKLTQVEHACSCHSSALCSSGDASSFHQQATKSQSRLCCRSERAHNRTVPLLSACKWRHGRSGRFVALSS